MASKSTNENWGPRTLPSFPHRVKLMELWRAYAHPGKVAANDPLRITI